MMMPSCASTGMNDVSNQAALEKPTRASLQVTDSGFVLHTYPYRETSVIAELFTQAHGRVVIVAKGAKRPKSATRGVLQPFQPLSLCWFGKAEMKTLKSAEAEQIFPQLSGAGLLAAFYVNELMLKLTHREDPHESLFDHYAATISALARRSPGESSTADIAIALRRFETAFLQELGYAIRFTEEVDSHAPIVPDGKYAYLVDRGPIAIEARGARPANALELSGKTLLDMANDDYADPHTQLQSKQLMRFLINHLLGDKVLHTRSLARELK